MTANQSAQPHAMMNGMSGFIEAHPDCEHLDFDVQDRCVRCGRDFAEQRAAGMISEAEERRECDLMERMMREHPEEFPTCRTVPVENGGIAYLTGGEG